MRKIAFMTAFFVLALAVQNFVFAENNGFIIDWSGVAVTGYTGDSGIAVVPGGVREIAFAPAAGGGTEKISRLIMPASVTDVAGLSQCTALAAIDVEADNTALKSFDGVLYSKDMTCLIAYPRAKTDAVFIIPESVQKIRMGAVAGNPYLESVVFPAGLRELGTGNFTDCKNLKSLTVPEENPCYAVAGGLLYSKDGKTLVLCPGGTSGKTAVKDGTEVIGYGAFSGCGGVTEAVLPESLLSIMTMAFAGCTGLQSLSLPVGLESINAACFLGCTALETIEAGKSDRYQSVDGILYSRDMLDLILCPPGKAGAVVIPEGVRTVTNGAFDGCAKITEIRLPDSMESAKRAFLNCTALKYFEVPETQSILDYCMFMGCTEMEWVYLPCNVVIIQDRVFAGCNPVIYCDEDSYAEMYAMEHDMAYRYMVHVTLNNEKVWFDQPPVLEKDTVLMPIRAVFEALGAAVDWDAETKTVFARNGETQVKITAEEKQMLVRQGEITYMVGLSTPARIENGRMLVPLRAVSEAFLAEVNWDAKTKTVRIEK